MISLFKNVLQLSHDYRYSCWDWCRQRICTKVPKELNSDKNKTTIEQLVRIILSLKWHHGNCVILRGAKLLTIKHAGVSVILLFQNILNEAIRWKKYHTEFLQTNNKILKNRFIKEAGYPSSLLEDYKNDFFLYMYNPAILSSKVKFNMF